MKLRLRRQYQGWAPGSVVDFAPGVADMLLQRGIAERLEADGPTPIAERPPRNTACSRRQVRRKAV